MERAVKQYLNTLYITTQESYLSKDGECICIHQEGREKRRFPIHTLGGLVLFGTVSCSPYLLGHCAENGVTVSWLTENGRFMAAMQGPVSGNVLLRRAQYRKADDAASSASLARSFCTGKVYNSRTILRRNAREQLNSASAKRLEEACSRLSHCLARLRTETNLDITRGIEGEAANVYFSVFDCLISNTDDSFAFNGRNRRPPLDAVNCLLSFLYTLLTHDARSSLEAVGLDPAVGFLHRDRPGRPSLALDAMEEFRPYLVDRLACTLINKGQVKPKGFRKTESGAVIMDDETRKTVLTAWQARKKEEIEHPFLQEKIPVGLLWHMQAKLLAKTIRNELEAYPPFVVR